MTFSADQVEITDALKGVLEDAKGELGLAGVYYGPERLIPEFPAATVESSSELRRIDGASTHKWRVDFDVFINLVYGRVQSGEVNQREAEQLAQKVKAALHVDKRLGGLVIFSFVNRIEPVLLRGDPILRSMRLTWSGVSQEFF